MRTLLTFTIILSCLALGGGCARPKGKTMLERRQFTRDMRDKVLADLYATKPDLKQRIEQAAGYAAFSNVNIHLILLSTGHGYGMIVDNREDSETFMRMAEVGVGVGAGLKDLRAVMIFPNRTVMETFRDKGWQFGGQAQAAAKADDIGGSLGAQGAVSEGGGSVGAGAEGGTKGAMASHGIEIYRLTKAGLALHATLAGTKYWKDGKLNE